MPSADRILRMGTEGAFRVRARAVALEAAGRDVIHLEMGEPDFPTPTHVVEAAVDALRAGHTGYAPAAGWAPLRAAIAADVASSRGIPVDPAQVVVCPGAKPVIFHTFLAVVNAGDEVVYPDPGFPIFASLVNALGGVPRPYHPGNGAATRPDLAGMAAAITDRTRLVILNSPSNPTGVVHRADEIARIADLCRGRDLVVLSDEIYSRILFEGKHHSIASVPGLAEQTVILDGFSKTWSMTGWRLGYAVAPPVLAQHLETLMTNSTSCAVNFVQRAGLAALQGDASPVDRMVSAFRARRDALVDGLAGLPGVTCERPEGAFFAFADVRGTGWDAGELADLLLEEAGVACVEGSDFGRAGRGFLRFSCTAEVGRIQEAIQRMRNLLAH